MLTFSLPAQGLQMLCIYASLSCFPFPLPSPSLLSFPVLQEQKATGFEPNIHPHCLGQKAGQG